MRKQKLLYIIHGIRTGGAEIAFLSALTDLENTYDFKAIVLGKSDERLLEHVPDRVKSRLERYNYSLPVLCLYLPAILRSIRRFSPDIMLSSLWRSAVPAIWYKRLNPAVRYAVMVHSSRFFHAADRFFTKRAVRRSDAVYVDSTATKQFLQLHLNRTTQVQVLSFLTFKGPDTITPPPYSEKRFCFVGRLHDVKNVPRAVEAIGWLRRQGIDAYLDIYGRDDGSWPAIKAAIQKYRLDDYVKWKGEFFPEKRSAVFSNYNFYIQLSSHEGMAMSVIEAMRHGLVCFVTPVGEIPAYVSHLETGVLIDINDGTRWEASLKLIKQVVSDPELCERIARESRRSFADQSDFSSDLIGALREFGGNFNRISYS